jgi:hypothetical protein
VPPPVKPKTPPPPPPPTPEQKLEKLAASGYVDPNDAAHFVSDMKALKPDKLKLREIKQFIIRHKSVFDRAAFEKIRAFCDTYRAENDID